MMPEEIPGVPDPFHTAPEEMISMMKGLAQLHVAAVMSGLPERTATQFIADVFVGFSVLNTPQNTVTDDTGEDSV
jgi:hypothetical protein